MSAVVGSGTGPSRPAQRPARTNCRRAVSGFAPGLGLARALPALFLASAAVTETVELRPVADTTLIEYAPDNNLGGQSFVNAGTTGTSAGQSRNRGLFRFDPRAVLPAGAVVVSAALVVEVVREPPGGAPSVFTLHRVLRPWGEGIQQSTSNPGLGALAGLGEATWRYRLAGTTNPWAAPGGAAGVDYASTGSASQLVYGTVASPYTFESNPALVGDVQHWMDHPDENQGWILKTEDEGTAKTARQFGAREDLLNAPRLVVGFTAPLHFDGLAIAGDTVVLAFTARAGWRYLVESSETLGAPAWLTLTNLPPAAAEGPVRVTDAFGSGRRFYRLQGTAP